MRTKQPSQDGAPCHERCRNKLNYIFPYLGSAALVLALAAFMGLHVKEKALTRLAAEEGTIRIWDARTGQPVTQPLTSTGAVSFVSFSPDGKQIVTTSQDGKARIWDARTGKLVTAGATNSGAVASVWFDADGKGVVTTSRDGTVRIWDVRNGKELGTLSTNRSAITNAWFSPDGKQVITSSQDGKVRIWNADNGSQEVPGTGAKKP
jgi:WD40 repeat protein